MLKAFSLLEWTKKEESSTAGGCGRYDGGRYDGPALDATEIILLCATLRLYANVLFCFYGSQSVFRAVASRLQLHESYFCGDKLWLEPIFPAPLSSRRQTVF